MLQRRRLIVALTGAAILFGAGAWPSPVIRRTFAALYCEAVGPLLDEVTFGRQGRVHLVALDSGARDGAAGPGGARASADNISSDATAILSVVARQGTLQLGISLRRDVFLPLLLFVSLLIPAPLRRRYKVGCLVWGTATLILTSAGALLLLVVWAFAEQARDVYTLGATARMALDLACRVLLAPPANRFMGPLLLAGLMISAPMLSRRVTGQGAIPSGGGPNRRVRQSSTPH